ncbi:hypothetical protein LZ32DRAFT_610781 [Colletotrichum eremochloae]|nr:hypothetical protein LZ32DRAFT_610781 [Colletotrichum eremochloae]
MVQGLGKRRPAKGWSSEIGQSPVSRANRSGFVLDTQPIDPAGTRIRKKSIGWHAWLSDRNSVDIVTPALGSLVCYLSLFFPFTLLIHPSSPFLRRPGWVTTRGKGERERKGLRKGGGNKKQWFTDWPAGQKARRLKHIDHR